MSLSQADCAKAADDLYQAEMTGQQIGLLSLRHPGMDMDDAYAIQSALVAKKLAAGRKKVGWKIGLTSKAMQAALNIDIPDSGVLFDDKRHAVDAHDLRWVGAIVMKNGEVEETGLGAGVLNDPVESVVWLAQRMAQYGQKIKAGQIILSGSFTRPLECLPGSAIAADFGAFGSVGIDFG